MYWQPVRIPGLPWIAGSSIGGNRFGIRGDTKQCVRLKTGIELDLRVVPQASFGAAMQYFTGSKEHNIVRQRAKDLNLKVNEYGVFRR